MSILDQLTKLSVIIQPVTVQGETFYVRAISGLEMDVWVEYLSNPTTDRNAHSKLWANFLVKALSDSSGNREFTDNDVEVVASQNTHVLHELFDAAYAINKMGEAGVAEEKKDYAVAQT